MAASAAKITSLDALVRLRNALIQFGADVEVALVTLELEGRRGVDWIENDRSRYWPREVQRASDALSEARRTLERCEQTISGEDTKFCYDERKAVEKANRRLRLCEEKVQAVRRWRVQMRKEFEEFQVQIAKCRGYLETDLPKAVASLERMSTALDRYIEQQQQP